MDRNTIIFIALIAILFLGQVILTESFVSSPVLFSEMIDYTRQSIKEQAYNPNTYYNRFPSNKGVKSSATYNGYKWGFTSGLKPVNGSFSIGGETDASGNSKSPIMPKDILGSTAGAPSDTNSYWMREPAIPEDILSKIIRQNISLSSADIMNKLIQTGMYSPNKYYNYTSASDDSRSSIFNGNLWQIESNVNILGSTAGPPSPTNSKWKMVSLEMMPSDYVAAIKKTAIAGLDTPTAKPKPTSPDMTGKTVVSLSDLFIFFNSRKAAQAPAPARAPAPAPNASIDYSSMQREIINDVKSAVRDEMNSHLPGLINSRNIESNLDDSYVESFAAKQAADFMRYIPARTPTF